jgi:hypothetical protein
MKYKVKKGFMAYQFGTQPKYCIGIEVNALKNAWDYECTIGQEEKEYLIDYDKALDIANKYGSDEVIRKIGGKSVFIIPVEDMEVRGLKDDNLKLI